MHEYILTPSSLLSAVSVGFKVRGRQSKTRLLKTKDWGLRDGGRYDEKWKITSCSSRFEQGEDIINVLDRLSKTKLPGSLVSLIMDSTRAYGVVKVCVRPLGR